MGGVNFIFCKQNFWKLWVDKWQTLGRRLDNQTESTIVLVHESRFQCEYWQQNGLMQWWWWMKTDYFVITLLFVFHRYWQTLDIQLDLHRNYGLDLLIIILHKMAWNIVLLNFISTNLAQCSFKLKLHIPRENFRSHLITLINAPSIKKHISWKVKGLIIVSTYLWIFNHYKQNVWRWLLMM